MIIRKIFFLLLLLFLSGCGGGGNDTETGAGEGGTDQSTESAAAQEDAEIGQDEVAPLERLIVVIGDSIGAGVGANTNYPAIIEGRTGIPVINVSTPGISAEAGASRAPDVIERFRPMYLVVLLGTNNATGAAGGISGAISALQFAASVANGAGVVPVIGTLPPISRDVNENAAASAISGGILGIGGARIARIDAAVSISDIADGLHPNDNGQNIIGALFAEQIY